MSDEIVIIEEVAALLKLAGKTVCDMAQAGQIPAFPWTLARQAYRA